MILFPPSSSPPPPADRVHHRFPPSSRFCLPSSSSFKHGTSMVTACHLSRGSSADTSSRVNVSSVVTLRALALPWRSRSLPGHSWTTRIEACWSLAARAMLDALRTTISGHSASVPCMESDAMAFHVMITSSAWSAQDCAKILATRARCWSRSGEEEEEDEERNNALLHLAIFSAAVLLRPSSLTFPSSIIWLASNSVVASVPNFSAVPFPMPSSNLIGELLPCLRRFVRFCAFFSVHCRTSRTFFSSQTFPNSFALGFRGLPSSIASHSSMARA
mmetsp:Transcript_39188/g.92400  ORF Transcript_39188/g.92400 Transcript_39188/m.92400 type:complete len:275 (+) Transcript_39188:168-992(+)